MKKIKQIGNKFLAVLLTAAMVFALSPLPAEAAVSNNSMPEVYVYERSLKWDGTEENPTTWVMALDWVQDGGTVYVMDESISIKNGSDASTLAAKTEGKHITLKPYNGSRTDLNLEDPLLKYQYSGDCTVSNLTFDGDSLAADTYNYSMVYVDQGTLTLQNCRLENHQNNNYGAALDLYSGATVNLEGTTIANNKTGTKSGGGTAAAGGVTVNGTLRVDGNSSITGNYLYDDDENPLDILVSHGGKVFLDGGAEVGTIGFSSSKTNSDKVCFTSALEHEIAFRMHKYYNNTALLAAFNTGDVLAEGMDGFQLTTEDLAKINITKANKPICYVEQNSGKQAYVNRDCTIYLSDELNTEQGSFSVSARPQGHEGRPLGSTVTIKPAPKEGYQYRAGTIRVKGYNYPYTDYTSSLTPLSDGSGWTLIMPDDIVLYAEFEDAKAPQTVFDPSHLNEDGSFAYTLVAGEDVSMPLTMENSTVFEEDDTVPQPLISFALADPDSDIIRLDGNVIIPLKLGSTVVNASAEKTDSHRALLQPITVKVVRPLAVALTAAAYKQENGLEFVPSYTDGSEEPYTIDDTTRFLGLRKTGDTALTVFPQGSWNWDQAYTQSFEGLEADTEYELVLRADDRRTSPKTAEYILKFRTPEAGSEDTGGISGEVEGTGDITVRVERGNTVIASQTGLKTGERFQFTHLPDGFYNLVATNGQYTVTVMVQVQNGGTTELNVVYVGTKQSIVKVEQGAPPVAADKLGSLFEEEIYKGDDQAPETVKNGGTVEIKLTAALPDDTGADKTPVEAIAARAVNEGKTVGLQVNLTVDMVIKPSDPDLLGTTKPLTDTGALVEIALPLPEEVRGKTGYQILRYHGAAVDSLRKIKVTDKPVEESFYISGGYAHIFAHKFSTYAIAYDQGAGGHSSGVCTLVFETNGGGKLAAQEYPYGTTVRLEKTPWREGYTFLGWYSDRELTRPVTELVMNGSRTVYAKWKVTEIPAALNGTDHNAYLVGFEDGTVRPDAPVTRAEVAMIFYRLLKEDVRIQFETEQNPFADVNAPSWYNTAVSTLAGMGILNGRTSASFAPGQPITRGEFAAVAARFSGESYSGGDLFPDIKTHWAKESINLAASLGWVGGLQDGTFAPESSITRAEAVTLVNRMLLRLPAGKESLLPEMRTWPDNADENQWYYLAVQEASNSHNYQLDGDGVHENWTSLQ